MKLVGAAVVPSAPILVPGMSQSPPAELDAVREAVAAALTALPPCHLLLLLAGSWRDEAAGAYGGGLADLGGLSGPELHIGIGGFPLEADRLAAAASIPRRDGPLPVDLATLALLAWPGAEARGAHGTLTFAVPFGDAARLDAVASAIELALTEPFELDVAVVAAGDLAAGHSEKAPRHLVAGCGEWDEAVERAVSTGVWPELDALGPDEARRVGARGWPALAVVGRLLGERRLDVAYREAPRGVGYLVGST